MQPTPGPDDPTRLHRGLLYALALVIPLWTVIAIIALLAKAAIR